MAREIARVQDRIKSARVGAVIATSGTAAALVGVASHLMRAEKRRSATYASREMIRRIAKLVTRQTLEQRQKVPGLVRGGLRFFVLARSCIRNYLSAAISQGFAIRRSACATASWARWRQNTIAAPDRAER